MPDSNQKYKDFFCVKCQKHKNMKLFSQKRKNRSYCTTCMLPLEEQEAIGIVSIYSQEATQQAATGETHVSKKTS